MSPPTPSTGLLCRRRPGGWPRTWIRPAPACSTSPPRLGRSPPSSCGDWTAEPWTTKKFAPPVGRNGEFWIVLLVGGLGEPERPPMVVRPAEGPRRARPRGSDDRTSRRGLPHRGRAGVRPPDRRARHDRPPRGHGADRALLPCLCGTAARPAAAGAG